LRYWQELQCGCSRAVINYGIDAYLPLQNLFFEFLKRYIVLPTPERIKEYIANGLECSHLEVDGDGQHFTALIVSPAFAGKRLIQRHQLVYAALGDRMREEIHALSMKTLTPEEHQS
jgi:acid stress-induced BolA-like protein IbaG/YrbA